jgi:hypothetical protein
MTSVVTALAGFLAVCVAANAQEARIDVRADQVAHRLSHYLTGACIEDVNHEVYGGLYSQMIFGESFQEPPCPPKLDELTTYGGRWTPKGGELEADAGDGPKVIADQAGFATGEVHVEVWLSKKQGGGNAGLLAKVGQVGNGVDSFAGYEISLEPGAGVVLGRHRQNWEPIRTVPCNLPLEQWIALTVRTTENSLEIRVNDETVIQYEDTEHPLRTGTVGLRTWQHDARFRNFWVETGGKRRSIPFEPAKEEWQGDVSGMWHVVQSGSAQGEFCLETNNPFVGCQCQRITYQGGKGELGIENQGLNGQGMYFIKGKTYEGCIWARAAEPVEALVALESRDGTRVYAEQRLKVVSNRWQRLDFRLNPGKTDKTGRFSVKLKKAGSVAVGYVFLQPGEWGRFQGLPVRKDVAEGLIDQGLTVLRYGGCMANAPEYRWKKMTGPRDQRPPYHGWWYPHASNGWEIPDFLNFCEAAGFLAVPDFNLDEKPQDMADFIQYVNGPASSEWGRKRVADGHPKPYGLKYMELGNEERLNEKYWDRFKLLAETIWAQDADMILVVGDFCYWEMISDPFKLKGSENSGGLTSMAAHQKILELARRHNREVWFDVHLDTDGPNESGSVKALPGYVEAIDRISGGARHRVVVFELNAGNPRHRRALANARAIHMAERLNLPIMTSANCLQPDRQNDNGWDQGLLFLNPSQVWLQPPGYVTRMISRNYQPLLVKSEVQSSGGNLDVCATRSEDGQTLVLQVVNFSDQPQEAAIHLTGFTPSQSVATAEELAGPLDAMNTAEATNFIKPIQKEWKHEFADGAVRYTFRSHSFTLLRFE